MKLMTADQVRAALSVRDLTDPNQGPHAMQLLLARQRERVERIDVARTPSLAPSQCAHRGHVLPHVCQSADRSHPTGLRLRDHPARMLYSPPRHRQVPEDRANVHLQAALALLDGSRRLPSSAGISQVEIRQSVACSFPLNTCSRGASRPRVQSPLDSSKDAPGLVLGGCCAARPHPTVRRLLFDGHPVKPVPATGCVQSRTPRPPTATVSTGPAGGEDPLRGGHQSPLTLT